MLHTYSEKSTITSNILQKENDYVAPRKFCEAVRIGQFTSCIFLILNNVFVVLYQLVERNAYIIVGQFFAP